VSVYHTYRISQTYNLYTSVYVCPCTYVRPRNVHTTRHSPAIVVSRWRAHRCHLVTVNSVARRYLYEHKYDWINFKELWAARTLESLGDLSISRHAHFLFLSLSWKDEEKYLKKCIYIHIYIFTYIYIYIYIYISNISISFYVFLRRNRGHPRELCVR